MKPNANFRIFTNPKSRTAKSPSERQRSWASSSLLRCSALSSLALATRSVENRPSLQPHLLRQRQPLTAATPNPHQEALRVRHLPLKSSQQQLPRLRSCRSTPRLAAPTPAQTEDTQQMPDPGRPRADVPSARADVPAEPVTRPGKPAAVVPVVASAPAPGSSVVQVAAMSHQEDADVVAADLKRRGYTVAIRREPQDKLFHVQLGPFSSKKEADAMRQRLQGDGYNSAILK